MRKLLLGAVISMVAACGSVYKSPDVKAGMGAHSKVRVVPITAENALIANRSPYEPRLLPDAFNQSAGAGGTLRGTGALPAASSRRQSQTSSTETRLPPSARTGPYMIGIGDVVLLATPQRNGTAAELAGLLAAQNRRQGYTVQDDGSIAIPNVGRVKLAGMTMEQAEATLFQKLVENQVDPSFSLEIAEFNSKTVSIGGAVARPTMAPITLSPLRLGDALTSAGGVHVGDPASATIRIYRAGTLYQVPYKTYLSSSDAQNLRLAADDRIFVDTSYSLDQAQTYFQEQIALSQTRISARRTALDELRTAVSLRRADLDERRSNFAQKLDLNAVEQDYVYLTGEVGKQSRFALPFERRATLADALYDGAGGVPTKTGNPAEIYVLRGSNDPREFDSITAWHLNAQNASNLLLATRFELRPSDIVFVAEQKVTRWNRVIQQMVPSLITGGLAAAAN